MAIVYNGVFGHCNVFLVWEQNKKKTCILNLESVFSATRVLPEVLVRVGNKKRGYGVRRLVNRDAGL